MSQLMLLGNPARRRKTRKNPKRRHARSAAQRAATMRMLAANRSRDGHRRRRSVVRANPVHRRRYGRRTRRNPINLFGGSSGGMNLSSMVKQGAIQGVGAVGVDVTFGFIAPMLPATMNTPVASDGVTTQWLYFVAKGAVAVGIAALLRKSGGKAAAIGRAMAEGSLTVMSYQIARSMFASFAPSIALGAYTNTQRTMVNQQRSRLSGMGAYTRPSMYQGNIIRASR